ncbi:hypothetical protein NN6n1_35670 [Shinella zoogloeoides]
MTQNSASTAAGQSSADVKAAVQALIIEGKSTREIADILGIPPRGVTRLRIKCRGKIEPGITPAVELPAPAPKPPKPPKITKPKPTEADVRERIATDELTVPFSNWLGNGWYREAGEPQDIYETNEDGEQQLVGVKIDPGVLWPDEWPGPKSVDDIWISPNVPAPKRSLKRGFVTTSAQSLTPAHGPFVINLHALAAARGLEFSDIGGFTYGKSLFAKKRKKDLLEVAPWSAMISDQVTRERRHLHSTVQACYEMNMRPTKQNPLVGLSDYVRGKTSIFAHPKRAVESVPRPKSYDPVTMWTTGCCTVPNYVTQEAGLKSLQEHQIGALIVEIDMDDNVFIRTVDADPETGNLHDLDLFVTAGNVYTLDEAITISDGIVQRPFMGVPCTHRANLNPGFARAMWGYNGNPTGDVPLIDLVKACGQSFNDLFDGESINHHEERDPIAMYMRTAEKRNRIEPEIEQAARFLTETSRPWCTSYITYSNHDDFLARWLRKPSTEVALENSKIWHLANYEWRHAIDEGREFDVFQWLLRRANPAAEFQIVTSDDPLVVYGVHYEFHGDKSPNGAKGTTAGLAKMGIKIVKAHSHQVSRRGRTTDLGNLMGDARYAKGPTSWGTAFSLGHSDGNVQMGLLVGDKYRA